MSPAVGRFGLVDVEADLRYCTNPTLDLRVFADATGVPGAVGAVVSAADAGAAFITTSAVTAALSAVSLGIRTESSGKHDGQH